MLKDLVIKVDNKAIHLSPELSIPIDQTNIPKMYLTFRTYEGIFWKVNLLEYNSNTKCWKVEVTDYFPKDINNFSKQESTKEVERIAFEKFDWPQLERHLSSYQKSMLLDVLRNHDTNRFFRESPSFTPLNSAVDKKYIIQTNSNLPLQVNTHIFNNIERNPIIIVHDVEFSIDFTEATFILGYVTFNRYIDDVGASIDFKIKNDNILAEFDNIKSWFPKKLKRKKFTVTAAIKTTDGKVTEVVATSPQIEMIDTGLIDSIKYQRTILLTKPRQVASMDKSLFTAEEIFNDLTPDEKEGNAFKQSEHDIMRVLIDKHKTRNKKQLEYLSASKQSENAKLRFTLHPLFGFLFLIEGKENNHFVWELLNSHATYIWSITKTEGEMELQYKRIEHSINTIRDSGRETYKRGYRESKHDNDFVFCFIEHDEITSTSDDGFLKWEHKLNEKLT